NRTLLYAGAQFAQCRSGELSQFGNGVLCSEYYRLQLQSPLPVLQWPQRQESALQKQVPLGAAAFSAGVFSTGAGGGVHPVAIRTAASNIRSLVIVPSWVSLNRLILPHESGRGRSVAVSFERSSS